VKEAKIGEAKTNFSQLVQRAEAGEEIVIKRGNTPVAVLSKYHAPTARKPGRLKGRVKIHKDFDRLPDDLAEAFGLKG
jgi:prevent-host-death family protein